MPLMPLDYHLFEFLCALQCGTVQYLCGVVCTEAVCSGSKYCCLKTTLAPQHRYEWTCASSFAVFSSWAVCVHSSSQAAVCAGWQTTWPVCCFRAAAPFRPDECADLGCRLLVQCAVLLGLFGLFGFVSSDHCVSSSVGLRVCSGSSFSPRSFILRYERQSSILIVPCNSFNACVCGAARSSRCACCQDCGQGRRACAFVPNRARCYSIATLTRPSCQFSRSC